MPNDQTRNVSLTAELDPSIHGQAALGRSRQAKKVVCAGLHLLIQTWRDLEANPSPKSRGFDGR
jgi:hypothetical protein